MPCGPASAASCRQKPSMAAQATPKPPTLGYPMTALAVMARMTPDPFLRIWRAAAGAVGESGAIAVTNREAEHPRSLPLHRLPLRVPIPNAVDRRLMRLPESDPY